MIVDHILHKPRCGMLVSVLRNAEFGDCTNGGVSAQAAKLLLIGDGIPGIFEQRDDVPTVKLVRRQLVGGEYLHVEPVVRPDPGKAGWMAGGNFVWSCDSRFRQVSERPLPIHDRQEG